MKPADPSAPGSEVDAWRATLADEYARVLAACPEGQKAALRSWAETAPERFDLLRGECKAPPAACAALRAGGRQEQAAKASCSARETSQRTSDAMRRSTEARHARAAALRAAPEQAQEGGEQAQEGGQAQVGGGVLGREPT